MEQTTTVRDVLLDTYRRHGRLTAEILVEEAADTHHPLHHRFEWDDAIAGHQYRLNQGQAIIREVKVTFGSEGERKRVRAFVGVHRPDSTQAKDYVPTDEIEDPLTRNLILADFEREWKQFRTRWEHLQEFWETINGD